MGERNGTLGEGLTLAAEKRTVETESEGRMETYRITRCKMGFRSITDMPEWMIIMEFRDMAQMDEAFRRVAPLQGDLETKHRSFNQFVAGDIQHALFRDWPDLNL